MRDHSAHDILTIIKRMTEYLADVGPPFYASDEDTNEELTKLLTAIQGWSAPRGEIPNRGLVGLLRDLGTDVGAALHARVDADKSEIGGFELERKWPSYNQTWDHARAAEEVAIAALIDENGAMPESPIDAANTVANAILSAGHVDYWRVTAGDKLGVDLRKFRERGEQTSPAGVILRRAKTVAAAPGESDPLLSSTDTAGNPPVEASN